MAAATAPSALPRPVAQGSGERTVPPRTARRGRRADALATPVPLPGVQGRAEQRGGGPWRPRPCPPLRRVPPPREAAHSRPRQEQRGGGGAPAPLPGVQGRADATPAAAPLPCRLGRRGAESPAGGPVEAASPSPRRPAASISAGGGAEEELRGHEPRASAPPPTEAGTGRPPPLALERRGQGGAQQRPPRRDPAVQEGVGEAAPSWSDTEEEERSRASAPSPAEAERGRPCRERRASRVAEARGRGRAGGRLVSSRGSPRNCGERGQRRIEDRRRGGGGGRGSGVLD